MTIKLEINLENTKYKNIEHRHMTLLLFLKKAQSFFYEASELLGSKDSYT